MGCTATILSTDEAMALPQEKRPLNYRIPGDLYHAVFEAVGHASACWVGGTGAAVFDNAEAERTAVDLCFRIADAMDKQTSLLSDALKAICLTRDYVGPRLLPMNPNWEWYSAGKAIAEAIPGDEWAHQFRLRTEPENKNLQTPKHITNLNAMDTPDPPPVTITPRPFKIPLTLKDVPPGTAIRRTAQEEYWSLITHANISRVSWGGSTASYEALMEDYEILIPGGMWKHAHGWDFAV